MARAIFRTSDWDMAFQIPAYAERGRLSDAIRLTTSPKLSPGALSFFKRSYASKSNRILFAPIAPSQKRRDGGIRLVSWGGPCGWLLRLCSRPLRRPLLDERADAFVLVVSRENQGEQRLLVP